MTESKFRLHWKDFDTNMTVAMKELREEKDFFDVTIACEDSQIQAHKVILSACSTFFRNLLRRNPHQHPLLYLKGVKYKDLLGIINFMYNGEVNVAQEELKQFLAVAEDLKVKGLTQKMAIPTHTTLQNKRDAGVKKTARQRKRPSLANKDSEVTSPEDKYREEGGHFEQKHKLDSCEKEADRETLCPSMASNATEGFYQIDNFIEGEDDELHGPVQPEYKELPRHKESPKVKVNKSNSPKKIRAATLQPTLMPDSFIQGTEVSTEVEHNSMHKALLRKSNTVGLVSNKSRIDIQQKVKLESTPISGPHWQCIICTNVFKTNEEIVEHMDEKHGIYSQNKLKYRRVFCT